MSTNTTRRKFLKTAAYSAPIVLTIKAAPSFAASGSIVQSTTGNLVVTGKKPSQPFTADDIIGPQDLVNVNDL